MNRRRKRRIPKGQPKGSADDLQVLLRVNACQNRVVARTVRHRVLGWAFRGMVIVMGLAMGAVMVRHAFIRAFVESEHFRLDRIEVTTNGRLTREQVLEVAGVREGGNLLAVRLDGVESAVGGLPQVSGVSVERILPDTLVIRIEERVPAAWVVCPAAGWRARSATQGLLADAAGRLFRCESLAAELLALPELVLESPVEVIPGRMLDDEAARAALSLLVGSEAVPVDGPEVRRVAVRNGYTLEVTLPDAGTALLSPDDTVGDFSRLAALLEAAHRRGERVVFANLLPRRNAVAQLATRGDGGAPRARLIETPGPAVEAVAPGPRDGVRAILNRRGKSG